MRLYTPRHSHSVATSTGASNAPKHLSELAMPTAGSEGTSDATVPNGVPGPTIDAPRPPPRYIRLQLLPIFVTGGRTLH